MPRRIRSAIFPAVMLAALTACASAPAAARTGVPSLQEPVHLADGRAELTARLDSLVRAVSDNPWAAGVSVVVLHGSDTLLARGYGRADVGLDVPATPQTKYRLLGPTTTMLVVLLMKQVEQGRITLDDDVSRWLPDFPWQGRTVTLRQLLDATSGLPNYYYLGDPYMAEIAVPKSQDEVTALFAGRPFMHEPGQRQQWTASGFHLAGILLERLTGRPFGELLEEEIIRPLVLENTAYCGGREIITNLATPYLGAGEGLLQAMPESPSSSPFDVSVCGSAGDVATFFRALRQGRLMEPATYAEMIALSATGEESFARRNQARAVGAFIGALEGHPMHFEFGGWEIGFNTAVLDLPEDDLTVVVLRNSAGRGSSYQLGENLSRAVLGLSPVEMREEPVPPLRDVRTTPEERARYAGVYRTRMVDSPSSRQSYRRTYRVYDENGRLMIQPLGEPPERLLKQDEHTFASAAYPARRLVFAIEDGRVSHIVLREGDRMLEQGEGVEEVPQLALRHVHVVDVLTGAVQKDRTVLVDGNRITAVGPSGRLSVPAAARVIDAPGQYVIPGLWDMHVHAFFQGMDGYLALLVANGVTGFREMGGAEIPLSAIHELRREILDGRRVAPRFIAGSLIDGPRTRLVNGEVTLIADSPQRVRVLVDSLAQEGVDFIKPYSRLEPEVYRALVERARARDIDVAGHVPFLVPAADASAVGQRSFEHLIGIENGCSSDEKELIALTRRSIAALEAGDTTVANELERDWRRHVVDTQDESRCARLYDLLRHNATWQTPTLLLCTGEAARDTARMRYLPEYMEDYWRVTRAGKLGADTASERALCRVRRAQVAAMSRAGVELLAGSDASYPGSWWGFGLHDELELLVDAGLTPLEALQSATIAPARFLGATDSLGAIARDRIADLVLLDASPLDDIANTRRIRGVVLDGRYLDRATLDSLLEIAARSAHGSAVASDPGDVGASPDLVLVDGRIFTGDASRPWVEALAIEGDRIAAIGTTAEIAALAGPGTRRIALAGRVAIPGINDAHIHSGGMPGRVLGFGSQDPSLGAVLDSLRAAVSRTEQGEWLRGSIGERILDDANVTRFVLDSVAPDHPVLLLGFLGHGVLLNSAALDALDIPENAPDPVGGWYRRMPGSGVIDGWLYGYADFDARTRLAALHDDSAAVAGLRRFAAEAARFGITTVQDLPPAGVDVTAERLQAAAVPIRWRLIDFPMTAAAAGAAAGAQQRLPLKWILDGTPLERGPLLRQPYADRPDWHGRAYFSADSIGAMIEEAARGERQLVLHAGGDSTLAVIFAAMRDAAPDSVWQQRRLRIEHGDFLMPDQIPVARERRVVIVQNPAHLTLPPLMAARFGERSGSIQSLRSLVEAGIPLALGSDGPLNPFLNILFATTHPANPGEALTREQAVRAYTHGSAYAEFSEHEKGMIVPGYLADIAVLSDDVFSIAPDALPGITSVLTIVGGRVVHDEM